MNNGWTSVEDEMPPMTPHGQDGSTVRVLVWVEKDYYPHVYTGSAEYSEDGTMWYADGLDHMRHIGWKVTHWRQEPEGPK